MAVLEDAPFPDIGVVMLSIRSSLSQPSRGSPRSTCHEKPQAARGCEESCAATRGWRYWLVRALDPHLMARNCKPLKGARSRTKQRAAGSPGLPELLFGGIFLRVACHYSPGCSRNRVTSPPPTQLGLQHNIHACLLSKADRFGGGYGWQEIRWSRPRAGGRLHP